MLAASGAVAGWTVHPAAVNTSPPPVVHAVEHQPDRAEALLRWWLYNDQKWNLKEIEAAEQDAK